MINYEYISFSNSEIPFTNIYVIKGVEYLIGVDKANILNSYTTETADSFTPLYTLKIDDVEGNNLLTNRILLGEDLTSFSGLPFHMVATPLENIETELTSTNLGGEIKLVYDVQRV